MQQHMPATRAVSLIHNDYKYDNVVLNSNDITRIVGVLDWEMCTIGDALSDLGTALAYWVDKTDPDGSAAKSLGAHNRGPAVSHAQKSCTITLKKRDATLPKSLSTLLCPLQTGRNRAADLFSLSPRIDERRALCIHARKNPDAFPRCPVQRADRENLARI